MNITSPQKSINEYLALGGVNSMKSKFIDLKYDKRMFRDRMFELNEFIINVK